MTAPNDLSAFWMPFTANRRFKSDPRMMAAAQGMYYTSTDGRQILDGTAGLWCCNAGHGRAEIAQAIAKQAQELDFAHSFNLGHPIAFEAATRLCEIAPEPFTRAFFTNSGSESADTALKLALAYHRARGEGQRTRLIGRERGYHGTNFGGTSVGGIMPNRRVFGQLLTGVDHLRHTATPDQAFSRGQPASGAELAEDLVRLVGLHGDTIAAVIVEPVACSGGVVVPPEGYLQRLREICDDHGILLIFDEVITGFGRLGAAFGAQALGVMPDIITCAKGLTNGVVPMGAVLVQGHIEAAMMQGDPEMIELFHGYTYSGAPVPSAAALATLNIYRDGGLFERAAQLAPYWEAALHGLRDRKNVIDIRNLGLVGAVEMVARADAPGARGYEVFKSCFDSGLLVRFTGDTIALSPPLIVTEAQIDEMVGRLGEALDLVA